MKLSEYVKNLNDLIASRPETAEFDVITSKDDEGNGYSLVHYSPSVGTYNAEDNEFTPEVKPNAVCVN